METLRLGHNRLATLSVGLFDGLATLEALDLQGNPGSPLALTVSLAPGAGHGAFRATVDTGAPFAFEVPVSANHGTIEHCAAMAAGDTESNVFTVRRNPGAPSPASVDIGALPVLPAGHAGYVLERSADLPVQLPDPLHTVALVTPASDGARQAFVRIINRSERAGRVQIHAIDDSGERFGPVSLSLEARAAAHFNSQDLEGGAATKGLSGGVGDGEGDWRLELETDLDIEALAYIRTPDGFLTSIHQVAPKAQSGRSWVPFFNPGSNLGRQSRLRLVNAGDEEATIVIAARDARGARAPEGEVRLALGAGQGRTVSALELEEGAPGLEGRLGDGEGKWALTVSADPSVRVMSLLQSRSGHLANLSTTPLDPSRAACAALRSPAPSVRGTTGPQTRARVARKSASGGASAASVLRIVLSAADSAGTASAARTGATPPERIGVHRELPNAFRGDLAPRLDWVPGTGEAIVGAVSVTSPGAAALRTGLRVDLPPGGEMRFFDGQGERDEGWPVITRDDLHFEGGRPDILWSPVVPGETVGIEITLPSRQARSDFSLVIERASHIFVALEVGTAAPSPKRSAIEARADPGFIDVACRRDEFPANLENATAMIIFEFGGGSSVCSGTLLNDRDDASFVPYS